MAWVATAIAVEILLPLIINGWLDHRPGTLGGYLRFSIFLVALTLIVCVLSYLLPRWVWVTGQGFHLIRGLHCELKSFAELSGAVYALMADKIKVGDRTFDLLRFDDDQEIAVSPRVSLGELVRLLLDKGIPIQMTLRLGSDFGLFVVPGDWTLGRFSSLDEVEGVSHFVSTRTGLDVILIATDRPAAAKVVSERLEGSEVAFLDQVHGDTIFEVSAGGLAGKGDGLMTDVPGVGLMCVSADCPLVLMADLDGKAVGVCHASWRGTVKQIAFKLARKMAERYQIDPSRLVAGICPSAGPERYEVGQDVLDAALEGIGPHAREFFRERDGGKFLLDLWSANRDQLIRAGLKEENIHVAGVCTITRNDLFPSYRLEGKAAGRFAAVIAKTEE